jgi:SNF2 family DNA or RNA helicase
MSSLWKHQKQTLELHQQSQIVFDLSDAGTGKTLAALEAFRQRLRRGGGKMLVIAPKTLLETAWAAEIRKFCPDLTYSVAYASNRKKAFEADVDVYITNTDATKWLADQKPAFFARFDTLVVDELSDFKNKDAQRSKALKKISKHFKYRAGLTATPTANTIVDIWHQVLILDGGQRLGKSFYEFRNAVQTQKPNPKFPMYSIWEDKPEASAAVHALLKGITVRHPFSEVMKYVPENQEYFVHFRPNAKLQAAYQELKDAAILIAESGVVNAVNAAALRTKLLQVASGAVYGENGEVHVLDTQRSELIIDLVAQRKYCVVFYSWKHQLEELIKQAEKQRMTYAVINADTKDRDRNKIVQDYQAGKFKVIFMHPKTGAHGLTLTRGTSVIWCSPPDRADWLVQGKHRVYRGAQKEATESVMVCAQNTLEQKVYNNTTGKRFSMEELLQLLESKDE